MITHVPPLGRGRCPRHRRPWRCWLLPLVLLVAVGGVAYADGDPAPTAAGALTLDEALALARRHSWDLADAADRAAASADQARAARGGLLPQLSVRARHTRLSEVPAATISLASQPGAPSLPPVQLGESIAAQTALRAQVEQPLFSGGALSRRWQAGTARADAAAARVDAVAAADEAATTRAFVGLAQTQAQAAVLGRYVAALSAHRRELAALYQRGRGTRLDQQQLATRLAQAQAQAALAAAAVTGARAALAARLGRADDTGLTVVAPAPVSGPLAPLVDWLAAAQAANPSLAAAQAQAAAAAAGARAARGAFAPRLALVAGWNYDNPNERYFPPQSTFHDTWDASLVATWELWRGGQDFYGARAAGRESVVAARQVARLDEAIAVGLQRTLAQVAARRQELAASDAAERHAAAAVAEARALLAAGRLRPSDVLDAEAELSAAAAARVAAAAALATSFADAAELVGGRRQAMQLVGNHPARTLP